MLDNEKSIGDEEVQSKKVIKVVVIAFSIVELLVMVAIFIKHRVG